MPIKLASLAAFLALAVSVAARAASMPAVHITVVDGQLDTPVAGVFVLFQATGSRASNGHDGAPEPLFVVEGLSNAAGEIALPAQLFDAHAFAGGSFDGPDIILLRRGYAVQVLRNAPHSHADVRDFTSWPFEGRTVKLRRIVGESEQADAAQLAAEQAAQAIALAGPCAWRRFPRFLVAADRIAAEWNLRAATVGGGVLRHRVVARPLQQLLAHDASYVHSGCGSPRAFFDPYAR